MKSNYTIHEVKIAVMQSYCYSDVCRKLGLTTHGNNIKTVKNIINLENIDVTHFDRTYVMGRHNKGKYTADTILIENSLISRGVVKRFILKHNLLEYKCNECFITNVYNGKSIILTLEHKNGINNDNRLENLCFLCPNCHSQTGTYCGRNKPRTNVIKISTINDYNKGMIHPHLRRFSPSRDELIEVLQIHKSLVSVGKHYNVTDNAIRKRCRKLHIDFKSKLNTKRMVV